MISDAIKSAFIKRKDRKWDKMYWMIDVHDTILKGEYSSNQTYNPSSDAIEVLEWLTKREDMIIIIWTSSYGPDYDNLHTWFNDHYNIKFDYFNHNPECGNTDYAEFTEKPYFNILLDDKAGFVESDWKVIKETLIEIGEWKCYKDIGLDVQEICNSYCDDIDETENIKIICDAAIKSNNKIIGELWDADPNCFHEVEDRMDGGIKCKKCKG